MWDALREFFTWLMPWIPLVSFGIAACSAGVATWGLLLSRENSKTAKKALEMSEAQEARRMARLVVKVEEVTSERDEGDACRVISVRVLASNQSDLEGAIVGAELVVTYSIAGKPIVFGLAAQASPTSAKIHGSPGRLPIPCNLTKYGAVRGWVEFRIYDSQVVSPLEGMHLSVHDSRELVVTESIWGMV